MGTAAIPLEDLRHDTWRLIIEDISNRRPAEREALLARMDIEDRLRGLDAKECIFALDPQGILRRMDPSPTSGRGRGGHPLHATGA